LTPVVFYPQSVLSSFELAPNMTFSDGGVRKTEHGQVTASCSTPLVCLRVRADQTLASRTDLPGLSGYGGRRLMTLPAATLWHTSLRPVV
jgi:hypothetical protein